MLPCPCVAAAAPCTRLPAARVAHARPTPAGAPQDQQVIELVTGLLAQEKVTPEQAATILQQMLPPGTLSQLQAHLTTPRASEDVRYRWACLAPLLMGCEGGCVCVCVCVCVSSGQCDAMWRRVSAGLQQRHPEGPSRRVSPPCLPAPPRPQRTAQPGGRDARRQL